MPDFMVHSIPGSPFGRAVLATLVEKNADFHLVGVDPRSIKSQPHLSMHPFGRVPVLEHDGFRLYETQAILRYLDRVLPSPVLTPVDPKAAARMDQILCIADWYLHQGVNNVIGFQRIVRTRLLGLPPDEPAIAEAMPRAHVVMAELSRLLAGNGYLAGAEMSLADIIVASQMDFLAQTPEWGPLTAERPNLPAWLARMNARQSFQATTWERVAGMAKAA
ncbi:MAG TPA: glutathione S-transferase family protein [Steroidobacteraceae bacterium]|nr:glutathione S-transferase family protein [Steroidobacteraceae bacterium]